MPAIGPDFISFQVRDIDSSQAFYERYLGLVRSPAGPPHAVVFDTKPIAFAIREVVPGTDLAGAAQPGIGAGCNAAGAGTISSWPRRSAPSASSIACALRWVSSGTGSPMRS